MKTIDEKIRKISKTVGQTAIFTLGIRKGSKKIDLLGFEVIPAEESSKKSRNEVQDYMG